MPCLVKSKRQVGGKEQPLHPVEADTALQRRACAGLSG